MPDNREALRQLHNQTIADVGPSVHDAAVRGPVPDITPEELRNSAKRLLHGNRPAIESDDFRDVIRNCQQHNTDCDEVAKAYLQAADTIERLQARVAELTPSEERGPNSYADWKIVAQYPNGSWLVDGPCGERRRLSIESHRIAELEQQVKHLCADAAEADSDIRESARRVLPAEQVDGDRESVPTLQEVVEMVVAQVAALRADAELLDWLSDPSNTIGNVLLPTECVVENVDSLRGAIRAAMGRQSYFQR